MQSCDWFASTCKRRGSSNEVCEREQRQGRGRLLKDVWQRASYADYGEWSTVGRGAAKYAAGRRADARSLLTLGPLEPLQGIPVML